MGATAEDYAYIAQRLKEIRDEKERLYGPLHGGAPNARKPGAPLPDTTTPPPGGFVTPDGKPYEPDDEHMMWGV